MAKLLTDLRNGFWFAPTIIVLAAAALAMLALELDAIVGDDALSRFPRLFGAGAEGARHLLSAIASSTITVAGVVFSITIVALSLTAAQYSPRALRNFMGDRANQLVLGVFVGIYVYCLLILRTIRGGDESFVPGISIVVALALALTGIGFLIFFIHHIALSIQGSHIAARVASDTIDAICRTCEKPLHVSSNSREKALPAGFSWHAVPAAESGYIQQVDIDAIADRARAQHRVVRMEKRVGEFVIQGHPLFSVSGSELDDRSAVDAFQSAFAINTYRDVRQDPAFGLQQLVDIAMKALSPGVNDLGTARNVLHHITAVVCELARRDTDGERDVYREGALAVIVYGRTFEQFVHDAFAPIRRNVIDKPDLLIQLLEALGAIARTTQVADRHFVLTQHVDAIEEALKSRAMTSADATAIAEAVKQVRWMIARVPS